MTDENAITVQNPEQKKRGFGSMDPEKQRAIAQKGGRAAHAKGTAHQFTPEEARAAGRKGGERVSRDREHMSNIGKLGGIAKKNVAISFQLTGKI
jgi:general stress protein YciG